MPFWAPGGGRIRLGGRFYFAIRLFYPIFRLLIRPAKSTRPPRDISRNAKAHLVRQKFGVRPTCFFRAFSLKNRICGPRLGKKGPKNLDGGLSRAGGRGGGRPMWGHLGIWGIAGPILRNPPVRGVISADNPGTGRKAFFFWSQDTGGSVGSAFFCWVSYLEGRCDRFSQIGPLLACRGANRPRSRN